MPSLRSFVFVSFVLLILSWERQCLGFVPVSPTLYFRSRSALVRSSNQDSRPETLTDAYLTSQTVTPSVEPPSELDFAKHPAAVALPPLSELQIFTLIGSAFSGLLLGTISDFSLTSTIEPWIAPVFAAVTLVGVVFLLETESDLEKPKEIIQTIFGQPLLQLKNRIQTAIIQSLTNTRNAIIYKKNEMINSITSMPSRIKAAIVAWIASIVKSITDRIIEAIDQALAPIRAVMNEIKASIQAQIDLLTETTQRKIDEVLAPPRQVINDFQRSLQSLTSPAAVSLTSPPSTDSVAVAASEGVANPNRKIKKELPLRQESSRSEEPRPDATNAPRPATTTAGFTKILPKIPTLTLPEVTLPKPTIVSSPSRITKSRSNETPSKSKIPLTTPVIADTPRVSITSTKPKPSITVAATGNSPKKDQTISVRQETSPFSFNNWSNSFSKGRNSVTKLVTAKKGSATTPTTTATTANKNSRDTNSSNQTVTAASTKPTTTPSNATPRFFSVFSSPGKPKASPQLASPPPSTSSRNPKLASSSSNSVTTSSTSSSPSPLGGFNRFFSVRSTSVWNSNSEIDTTERPAQTTGAKAEKASNPVFSLGSKSRKSGTY